MKKFLISHKTVILNEGQDQSNRYQTAEISSFYHYTKYERNRSVNAQMQFNVRIVVAVVAVVVDDETTEEKFSPFNIDRMRQTE